MAESNQVASLSHTHEAVMNWMLVNPDKSLRECADQFGYTQSWLSTLIHSDIFQAQLAARQEGIRARIADSIPQKMRQAADVGIEKLIGKLEQTEDPEFILDATDKLLHRLGYAPQKVPSASPLGQGGTGNVQNNFFVTAGDLDRAREVMGRVGLSATASTTASSAGAQGVVIEGEVVSAPQAGPGE